MVNDRQVGMTGNEEWYKMGSDRYCMIALQWRMRYNAQ